MAPLHNRGMGPLNHHIRRVVPRGSIIKSDFWRGYLRLRAHGYRHIRINHTQHFVDAQGNHTNNIENVWSHFKIITRALRGIPVPYRVLYIAEFNYVWNHRRTRRGLFRNVLRTIGRFG
jgi:transposase